jgi:cysteinyl-tRNA synthetase
MIAGARVEVAPYKRDPADFVLWKPSNDDQPGWDSPWGRGRPGWHLECTTMIDRVLGVPVDIHGGGGDLQFPHHENERAQGLCGFDHAPAGEGDLYARYWMHNGMLTFGGGKMSKSEGRLVTVAEVLEGEHPVLGGMLAERRGEVVRLGLLSGQYRQPLDWSDELLEQSKKRLDRYYRALEGFEGQSAASEPGRHVLSALDDDLNTPAALAACDALAGELNKASSRDDKARLAGALWGSGRLLGLLSLTPAEWARNERDPRRHVKVIGSGHDLHVHWEEVGSTKPKSSQEQDDERIERLIEARNEARQARNFTEADRIRDDLAAEGIHLEDTPAGTTWRRA